VDSRYRRSLLVAAALLAGCRTEAETISEERFVAANVALRTLPETATDEQRAAVLARYRVAPADLHAWVRANEDHPDALAAAWRRVAERLDSLAAVEDGTIEDGAVAGPPAPPEGFDSLGVEREVKDFPLRLPETGEVVGAPPVDVLPPPPPREPGADRPGVERTREPKTIEPPGR
jgi:hypothetical protein